MDYPIACHILQDDNIEKSYDRYAYAGLILIYVVVFWLVL